MTPLHRHYPALLPEDDDIMYVAQERGSVTIGRMRAASANDAMRYARKILAEDNSPGAYPEPAHTKQEHHEYLAWFDRWIA